MLAYGRYTVVKFTVVKKSIKFKKNSGTQKSISKWVVIFHMNFHFIWDQPKAVSNIGESVDYDKEKINGILNTTMLNTSTVKLSP